MATSDGYNTLGEFIKAQRHLAELSQRELARIADVSDAYVSQLERGLHQPTVKVLRSIADALDVRAETMMRYAGWGGEAAGSKKSSGDGNTVSDGLDVERAIKADERLNDQQKQALLSVYRGFLGDD